MDKISKNRLIKGLKNLRKFLCEYHHDSLPASYVCGCNFGMDKWRLDPYGDCAAFGDASGCPEVKMACLIIESMTQEDFLRITRRIELQENRQEMNKPR